MTPGRSIRAVTWLVALAEEGRANGEGAWREEVAVRLWKKAASTPPPGR